MNKEEQKRKNQRLVNMTYWLVLIYNLVFFSGLFSSELCIPGWGNAFRFIHESYGLFTVLEFFGIAVIFVDLLGNYDHKSWRKRRWQLIVCALFIMSFIFKLFMVYLSSSVW
jgi:hypothetical protein